MENAREYVRKLLATLVETEGDKDPKDLLAYLGGYLITKYEEAGDLRYLEAAIEALEAAVELTLEGCPHRVECLNELATSLRRRYERTGNLQDLEAAIRHAETAVEATPYGHPDRAVFLGNLGNNLMNRYERTGALQDLEAARKHTTAALEATPDDHPDRAVFLGNLDNNLMHRYERTGALQDLEAAMKHTIAALEATPDDHPNRAGLLNNLGNSLMHRYNRTGDLQDLAAAISHANAALEATSDDHPSRAGRLGNLGTQFSHRYERTGDLQDLEATIKHANAAVEATPDGHPDLAGWLNNLGNSLCTRYERIGDLQDLEAAINHATAALEATPNGHPDCVWWWNNLGKKKSHRYDRTGDLQDLEEAIKHASAAVAATPDDHPDRANFLNNLGNWLSSRHERTGDLQDLEGAIKHANAAVAATPDDHPNLAQWLNNLSTHLSRRYKRTGNLQDLAAAIEHTNAAIEATPDDHPNLAGWLNNLGNWLSSRYEQNGDTQDLEAAINHATAAVKAAPDDHPEHAGLLNNLGTHLNSRYDRTGDPQDLEAAIKHANAAIEATPEDTPDRADQLNCLGGYLWSQYVRTDNLADLQAFISARLACWSIRTAPILVRVNAALRVVYILAFHPAAKDLPRACSLLHDAIHLIPLATSRSLSRVDQQHIVGKLAGQAVGNLTGPASLAISVLLEAGRSPMEALRLGALGRSVTNSQLLDYRSDISGLMKLHPILARDFDSLRQELDSPFPQIRSSDMSTQAYLQTQQAAIGRRKMVVQDLDNLLREIREKLGFENFLLGQSEEYLLSAAQPGPIVLLNVGEFRSDAILLTRAQVTSIALPNASHASTMKYFGPAAPMDDNEFIREMLEWLWKGVVQPVLQELGFYPNPKRVDLPRIWWMGVGLMSKAPIHAATKFRNGRVQMTTLHYCLPSYISTIRALQYSRSRPYSQLQNASTLIVTMPTTPGVSSLSGVTKEADRIKHSLGSLGAVDTLERPTAERVLQALPGYSIAHFACHGVSSINPADSHLLLLKGYLSHNNLYTEEVDMLRVNDIAALKLPTARLAYLSACSTAESTSTELIDEGTHIVSSFHIAGFPHVIGTLWSAQDEACPRMAAEFYSTLSKTDDVAISYRSAVLALMKQKPSQPAYWAPFIHFGA